MEFENSFSAIASLIGEPARAIMLWNLLDGRAYTAGELSICSNVTPQSASNHLQKMLAANLLCVEKQGRHRYYKIATPEVAYVIESIANLVPPSEKTHKKKELLSGEKYARTCYDHLAGKVAVDIVQSLIQKKILISKENDYEVSKKGIEWFAVLGIDIDSLKTKKRSFARPCLDWSERKHHLAGSVGASLLEKMIEFKWIRKIKNSRAVIVTPDGRMNLKTLLTIDV